MSSWIERPDDGWFAFLSRRRGETKSNPVVGEGAQDRRQREVLFQSIDLPLACTLEFFANHTPDNHLEGLGGGADVLV